MRAAFAGVAIAFAPYLSTVTCPMCSGTFSLLSGGRFSRLRRFECPECHAPLRMSKGYFAGVFRCSMVLAGVGAYLLGFGFDGIALSALILSIPISLPVFAIATYVRPPHLLDDYESPMHISRLGE